MAPTALVAPANSAFAETSDAGKPHPAVKLYTVDKPFQPDAHAGATETAVALKYFPGEVNTEVARTLKPQATWHPLGYVGDPANFDKVDLKNWADAHFEFLKDNIVAWLAAKNGKKETAAERK